jgi:hypothetical protein
MYKSPGVFTHLCKFTKRASRIRMRFGSRGDESRRGEQNCYLVGLNHHYRKNSAIHHYNDELHYRSTEPTGIGLSLTSADPLPFTH